MMTKSDAPAILGDLTTWYPELDAVDPLPWVRVGPGRRYLETEEGEPFLIIGQNDSLTWPELKGVIGRCDVPSVENHLAWLAAHGVNTLRVMLEYVGDGLYLEPTCGEFDPVTVRAIDDLVRLCERRGLRLLLTPFDTFFTWVNWDEHPYNARQGGPCPRRIDLLTLPEGMAAVKRRIAFAVERWGGSGAILGWDLWNEFGNDHGVRADLEELRDVSRLIPIVSELSALVRGLERRAFGKTHLQTVSHFGPEPKGPMADLFFRHPDLDFASTHIYDFGQIDAPTNTIAAADGMAGWVQHALDEIRDGRPFTDSETGPIHFFKDLGITLPEEFDVIYFRHMSWAHLASGGAGCGMRWPNRHPHVLTPGMRHAQAVMAEFGRLIDWPRFASRNITREIRAAPDDLLAYGCADDEQAVVWVVRDRRCLEIEGHLPFRPLLRDASLELPPMSPGTYRVAAIDTQNGHVLADSACDLGASCRLELPPFRHDLALAIRKVARGSKAH